MSRKQFLLACIMAMLLIEMPVNSQEPAAWGEELVFHTFSIAAVDLDTGESGVAVTTRNPCVGNGVPWVRAGVGAVATQASTRTEYGHELLDLIEEGMSPNEALEHSLKKDENAQRRQIGVIGIDGSSSQHSGSHTPWFGHKSGQTYVVQGNSLFGPEIINAVARTFEASEHTNRHLADRLIEALNAGQILGGDGRHGETQSAAVVVADPRPGMARRQDGLTVQINVCEHPNPVLEMRRIYDTVSETLGFRTLQQETGRDVFQLKLMLHTLGYFKKNEPELSYEGVDRNLYTQDVVEAVDRFREDQTWRTTIPGFVDKRTVRRLWEKLEELGKAKDLRKQLLNIQRIRR